jgi:two-component system LytT family response regulator
VTGAGPKIRTLIVDDEPLARRNLAALLPCDPEIEMLGECASGTEAVAAIRRLRPDLVFLDVQMPECDGFEVIERLAGDLPPTIIFVTAYDRYAIRAFEAGAQDYLLKPFDDARFELALRRAKDRLCRMADQRQAQPLIVRNRGEIVFIQLADIDWIEAADYYTCLHVGTATHLLRRSLSDLERTLDPGLFCRIHRSAIVNLRRVRSLAVNEAGDFEVLLDNAKLALSRRYRRRFELRLGVRC